MHDILIIGAGAAGLSAARQLAKAGKKIKVLEARDRIGGRVYTRRDELTIELGAEFVHGRHPLMIELLKEFDLPFTDVTERHWYVDEGRIGTSHEFWNKLTALMDLMDEKQPDVSFEQFLNTIPDTEETTRAKSVARLFVEGFHAARVDHIGVRGLIKANKAEDEIDGEHSFRLTGGYGPLMNKLYEDALSSGAEFHLNTVVSQIQWSRDGVEVVCRENNREVTHSAHRAVITLPLGVLQRSTSASNEVSTGSGNRVSATYGTASDSERAGLSTSRDESNLRFVPPLPNEYQTAINALAMGHAIRIALRFREPFWESIKLDEHHDLKELGFIHCPTAPLPTWWTQLPTHEALLIGWTGGSNAERIVSQIKNNFSDEVLSLAVDSLHLILRVPQSEIRNQLVAHHVHDWHNDPFTRGAYAYVPVNALAAQEALSKPIDGVLYFAGEALSVGHIGTVHGALDSGHRAAKDILSR